MIVLLCKCLFFGKAWTIGKLGCEKLNLTECSEVLILIQESLEYSLLVKQTMQKIWVFSIGEYVLWYSFAFLIDVGLIQLMTGAYRFLASVGLPEKLHKLRPAARDSSFNIGLAENLLL